MTPIRNIFIAAFYTLATLPVRAEIPMDFRAMMASEAAIGLNNTGFQKWDFTIRPEVNMDLADNIRLTAIGLVRLEATDNLEPGRPNQSMRGKLSRRAYIGDITEVELREFYIDTTIGNSYLRLGKQQIVWGQADGLRVLDVVNPFNYREFILDKFEARRIPLWSLNLEVPVGDMMAQFIWLPDQTYDQFPEKPAPFAITSPRFIPELSRQISVIINPVNKPDSFLTDSDAGVRLSTFIDGWDLTLNYLYHNQDRSILFQSRNQNGITINPQYRRTHLIGGTFSKAFSAITLRGEIGFSTDKYFLSRNISDTDGIHRSAEISYVIGFDYNGIKDSFLSAQFFQSIITDYVDRITRDKIDNQMTLLLDHDFMNDTIKAGFLLIHSLNESDGLIEFDIRYDFQDNITLSVGADLFYGRKQGLFGQFSKNNRLTISIEIGF